jgi:exopolysaccharide biosynthesis polyprenyl glycosylphosphotransferase
MTVARDAHELPLASAATKITNRRQPKAHAGRPYPWGRLAPLLRDGVRPLFIAGDAIACVATAFVVNAGGQSMLGVTFVMVSLLALGGLNRSRLSLSVLDDLPQIIRLWLVGAGFLVVMSELMTGSMQLVLLFGVLPAIVGVRTLVYGLVRHGRTKGSVTHPTVIVGSGSLGQVVVDALERHPESGLRAAGFVDSPPLDMETLAIPLLGQPAELTDVLVASRARALIVAHGGMTDADLVTLVRKCQRQACEVFILPRLHEITHVADDMDAVGDLPLIRLRRSAYRSPSWRVKRLIDVVVSAVAIVLLSPLLALLALAVRLETGRGVIFRQERVGRDGVSFEVMKFRSLKPMNDAESATNWNISHDNRVGPVGRVIRKTSLDELPQLFNILRGDMSLVGPRPERPHFVEQFGELYIGYADRHRVPCGLTGWAQIHGLRGNTPIDQRARFDNFYIENWTLWLDIKIILRTVVSVFTKPGS